MKKTLELKNITLSYELIRKNVKNINLRIRSDGSVVVSANVFVPESIINSFLRSKEDFIIKCFNKRNSKEELTEYFTEQDLKKYVVSFSKKIYPYYKERGIDFPEIKFRKMKSCWGNCRSQRRVLTFNTNLRYAPEECVKYVVFHEFTHFIQPNHSIEFYNELALVCPQWKSLKLQLKNIVLN